MKPIIEDKVMTAYESLMFHEAPLEERIYAFLSMLKYYRYINNKLFINSFYQFNDLMN